MDALFFSPLPSCPLFGSNSRSAPVYIGPRSQRYHHHRPPQARPPGAADAASRIRTSTDPDAVMSTTSPYIVPSPPLRLWPVSEGGDDGETRDGRSPAVEEEEKEGAAGAAVENPVRRGSRGRWLFMILRIRSLLQGDREAGTDSEDGLEGKQERADAAVSRLLEESDRCAGCCDGEWSEGCHVCEGGEDEEDGNLQQGQEEEEREAVEVNRDSFSRLLRRASLGDAKLYEKLSYLGSLAYAIPRINPANLLKVHGLRFVTSSLEKKKSNSVTPETDHGTSHKEKAEDTVNHPDHNNKKQQQQQQLHGNKQFTASDAYRIATSAASYLHSQTKSIIPFQDATTSNQGTDSFEAADSCCGTGGGRTVDPEEASFVVTTESVTAVVAAKKEVKEAVASDLNSSRTSPCEWFVCDDDNTGTRLFVIQGSESLASWQANLLFEPVQFEGLDVLVHRGIYEAAKGIYQQMLPHIQSHLRSRGPSATLRFTGHSLGGSLSLLINLMLLIRGQAPRSSLLPVITYGAPSIMCGGNYLLQKLGLPLNHVQAITMHRDIVPRAFSCTYPDRVADILKAVNGSFRKHPCLNQQKLLYAPMGQLLILQPDEKVSPGHHLLPTGSGLYFFGQPSSSPDSTTDSTTRRLLRAALSVFLNSPHPLEILGDRSAYGTDGAVVRDHDMGSYLKAMREVISMEQERIRQAEKERQKEKKKRRHGMQWPAIGPYAASPLARHFDVSGVLNGGMKSLRRFTGMIESQNMQLLVVALLPALGIVQNG